MELREYDIMYEPRKAIKAQVLVDFIVELPDNKGMNDNAPKLDNPKWSLFVDGASGFKHQSTGVILRRSKGMETTKSIKFTFHMKNNVAKYEALIVTLALAPKIGIKSF